MKKRVTINQLAELIILFLLLWGGTLVWKQFGTKTSFNKDLMETSFQYWFWLQRGPDLAIQAGLIFAGALGIATLLPGGRDKK
ncbi:MAG: hypothetical protein K8R77_15930 [Anaerolineaceae bacterium]|nr:hypothetical protein [Anaerolineaceae bacterium]